MGKIAEDFERLLYANYPDDYRRATAEDVSDDVITAILSRHEFHYEVWKRIPEWIRAEYRDDIPQEVLNGNIRVEAFVYDEYEKLGPADPLDAKEEKARDEKDAKNANIFLNSFNSVLLKKKNIMGRTRKNSIFIGIFVKYPG